MRRNHPSSQQKQQQQADRRYEYQHGQQRRPMLDSAGRKLDATAHKWRQMLSHDRGKIRAMRRRRREGQGGDQANQGGDPPVVQQQQSTLGQQENLQPLQQHSDRNQPQLTTPPRISRRHHPSDDDTLLVQQIEERNRRWSFLASPGRQYDPNNQNTTLNTTLHNKTPRRSVTWQRLDDSELEKALDAILFHDNNNRAIVPQTPATSPLQRQPAARNVHTHNDNSAKQPPVLPNHPESVPPGQPPNGSVLLPTTIQPLTSLAVSESDYLEADSERAPLLMSRRSNDGGSKTGWTLSYSSGGTTAEDDLFYDEDPEQPEPRHEPLKSSACGRVWHGVQWFLIRPVRRMLHVIRHSTLTYIALPALVVAYLLHEYGGAPCWSFLSWLDSSSNNNNDDATITTTQPRSCISLNWWLVFVARHAVSLELARLLQWLLIDQMAICSRIGPRLLGPSWLLLVAQAKGRPLVTVFWALVNAVLWHNNGAQGESRHVIFDAMSFLWQTATQSTDATTDDPSESWFSFFLDDTTGDWIWASGIYTRFLYCLLLFGISGVVKNTLLTLHFGRRHVKSYQPQLEEIVDRLIVVSEIAILATWALGFVGNHQNNSSGGGGGTLMDDDKNDAESSLQQAEDETSPTERQDNTAKNENNNDFDVGDSESLLPSDLVSQISSDSIREKYVKNKAAPDKYQSVLNRPDLGRERSDEDDAYGVARAPLHKQDTLKKLNSQIAAAAGTNMTASGRAPPHAENVPLKRKLYRWTPPLNKADDSDIITLADIYKFRKANQFLDRSEYFGRDARRDDCIDKAEEIYNNLLCLCGNEAALDYSVLSVLNQSEGGFLDELQEKAMKDLFRPDRNNNLSLVAFAQGCDNLFKRIQFYRASVGNASILDSYMEGVINFLYGIVIGIIMMAVLGFDPWPLLVSLSTVTVTLAFAIGPTVSKTIEGIMMVVVMRPYDIGDRIILCNTAKEVLDPDEAAKSWFVEDITFFTTTLRYGPSNEVAIVTNGSISSSRIVNCARSKKAKINIALDFHARFHDGDVAVRYFHRLQSFIADNRQCWKEIHLFACKSMDTAAELIHYNLRVESRRNWQSASAIMEERAELIAFCTRLARKMGVHYTRPKQRRIMYMGGNLRDGACSVEGGPVSNGYEADLLDEANISNSNNFVFPMIPKSGALSDPDKQS